MDLKDTIEGFKGILDGKYDSLPEQVRAASFAKQCEKSGMQLGEFQEMDLQNPFSRPFLQISSVRGFLLCP